MKETPTILIVTDLDGTLLDHNNYKYDEAMSALKIIEEQQVPLILNSSKTAAEIKVIRQSLNNKHPFVVENGAGIYLPTDTNAYEIIEFAEDRKEILLILQKIKEKLKLSYIGFNDMSVAELMLCTGLNKEQAELAKQRDFTEPLKWQDDDSQWLLFCEELEEVGLSFTKGGRFISVSTDLNKGQAVNWIRNYYEKELNLNPIIIALGDSENDKQMLENADYPILVKSPAHDFPDINVDNLTYTTEYGPAGWNKSVIKLLDSLL